MEFRSCLLLCLQSHGSPSLSQHANGGQSQSHLEDLVERYSKNRELEANELLGGLTALISVESDRHLIKALLKFWDTERLVFKFRDFELTPTIEEVGGFMGLAYKELEMIVPHKPSPRSFLKQMGMCHNPNLLCLKEGWISLEFLYSHFRD